MRVENVKKDKKKFARSSFLFKMLVTIGVLICVPMLFVQIFILYSANHALNSQSKEYNYLNTRELSGRFYAQLAEFQTIALKIGAANSTSMKKFVNKNAPEYTAISVSEELSNYKVSVPLAQTIGIYYVDRNVMVNQDYYYELDNFCTLFAAGNEDIETQVYELFTKPFTEKSRTFSAIDPANLQAARMIVAVPVKMNQVTEHDAIVCFTMNYNSVNKFLATTLESENYTHAVFSAGKGLLFTSNTRNLEQFSSASFQAYLVDRLQTTYRFEDSVNSIAYKWVNESSSEIFVTIVSEGGIEKYSSAFFQTMELILFINILVTAVLLALTAYINYSPLQKLVARISRSELKLPGSELDWIERAFKELSDRALGQGELIMDYVLNDLLYGAAIKAPELYKLIPDFDYRFFCAVSAACKQPAFAQSKQIAGLIEESIGCRIYITDIPDRENSLFICLSREPVDAGQLTQTIQRAIETVLQKACNVFAGSVVESLSEISNSYYISQAKSGEDDNFEYGKYDPSAEIHLFEYKIESGKIASALESLNNLFDHLNLHSHDRNLVRYTSYRVLIAYVSARKKAGNPISDKEFHQMLLFKDSADLHILLKASVIGMAEQRSAEGFTKADKPQEVLRYINEHFHLPDISLATVADQFEISIYTLSRLFKEHTGIGFKEYITAKRLEMASKLLITTHDTISSIALQTGFENPTYFSSLYRARYGVTPSKFRENLASQEECPSPY